MKPMRKGATTITTTIAMVAAANQSISTQKKLRDEKQTSNGNCGKRSLHTEGGGRGGGVPKESAANLKGSGQGKSVKIVENYMA